MDVLKRFLIGFFVLVSVGLPTVGLAQPTQTKVIRVIPTELAQRQTITPAELVATIFRFTIIISATIFLLLFLYGAVTYLTSAGNEDGTGKAKKILINATIGIVLVIVSFGIGTFILRLIGY